MNKKKCGNDLENYKKKQNLKMLGRIAKLRNAEGREMDVKSSLLKTIKNIKKIGRGAGKEGRA